MGVSGARAAEKRPNVLFVAIDDLNDWVGCMGGRKRGEVHTPHLDRLASKGVLFMNAHCAAPACNPSRTAVLWGVRPSTSGVYGNSQPPRLAPALRDALTLPEFLRKNGYHTAGGGKILHSLEWHDGEFDGYNDPPSWDEYFPSMKRQMPRRVMPPEVPIAKGKTGSKRQVPGFFDWGPVGRPSDTLPDHKVVDWAIGKLSMDYEKPFFLAVGIFRPHIPWYVPQEFFDLYPIESVDVPYNAPGWLEKLPPAGRQSGAVRRRWHGWVTKNDEWKKAVRGYLASISFADHQLGRLLDAFEKSRHRDDTIVVLWTDHGFHLGDKTTWEKFTLWEDSTQVPLMFVVPGVTKPGTVCHQPASLLDLYPTLLELIGFQLPANLEGTSLVPQLRDPGTSRSLPAICTSARGSHAVRDRRYHYIRYRNGDEELYDHEHDEGEWNNLAGVEKYADVKARLRKFLPKVNATPSPGGGRNGAASPRVR